MRWAAALLVVTLSTTPAWAGDRVVSIVPLGAVDRELLEVAVKAVEDRVDARARIEKRRELPQHAWYQPRKRWRAEKLLQWITAEAPPDAWKVVAITAAEISTTKGEIHDWRVGGLGTLDGKACVVSTWIHQRHSKSKAVLRRRVDDLVVHELGHTLGLDHCETDRCVMRDAKGKILESTDSSSGRFCEVCRRRVGDGVLRP